MTNPLFTNIVLVVIAALLLVLVIQNGMNHPSHYERPMISPHAMPMDGGAQVPAAPTGGANMGNSMFFAALKAFPAGCEGKAVLAECDSPAAQAVKIQIQSFADTGKGPRQVFDYIVETWGEKVLTDQALQIRSRRTKSQ